MSQPVAVDILSDDDDDFTGNRKYTVDLSTPLTVPSKKKQRTDESTPNWKETPTVFIIDDDDPTPSKPSKSTPSISDFSKSEVSFVKCSLGSSSTSNPMPSCLDLTPSMVAETPASELPKYSVPIVRCTKADAVSQDCSSSILYCDNNDRIDGLICLESDNESDNSGKPGGWMEGDKVYSAKSIAMDIELSSSPSGPTFSLGDYNFMRMAEDVSHGNLIEAGPSLDNGSPDEERDILEPQGEISRPKGKVKRNRSSGDGDEATGKTRMSKEEKLRLKEEKKQRKEQEKLQKAAQKAEAAEMKKLQKEMQKWEKGKFAHKSIVALIDTKVVELGSIGGHLLTRFAEKGLSYRISSNPIEKSIVWSMSVPEEISQISSEVIEVQYVLIIFEAKEFCSLLNQESLTSHVSRVQRLFPRHTVCYLTNRLMAYINKREQGQYKDPTNHTGWKRPPLEEALSKLTVNFNKVHSRHCVDESELAEHVVGLTFSLASCQFRNKLTRLSVNANGALIPKGCIDKNLINKSPWLRSLVAIPKVQPRFAVAIWKKYPTMKSLLHVYMDPSKSVHEKEFLLKDLKVEGLLGDDRRLGEVCSKRVYRILMAQSGSIKTDDIERGADFFRHHSAD